METPEKRQASLMKNSGYFQSRLIDRHDHADLSSAPVWPTCNDLMHGTSHDRLSHSAITLMISFEFDVWSTVNDPSAKSHGTSHHNHACFSFSLFSYVIQPCTYFIHLTCMLFSNSLVKASPRQCFTFF